MSERITEAKLRDMDAAIAEADRFGDDDHGIDTSRLVAEVRRLRALILAAHHGYSAVAEVAINAEARAIHLEAEAESELVPHQDQSKPKP